MIETFILIMGLIAIGGVMKRSSIFPDNTGDVLNIFILNISLPAIILVSIPQLKISFELLYPAVAHWILYFIHICLVLMAYKIFKFSRSVLGCLLVVSCLGNTAFLGIPMISGFFGGEAVPYAVLYDQLGSGLAFLFTMSFILPRFTGEDKKSLKQILISLLKFPPFIALVSGFILINYSIDSYIFNLIERISQTLIPCSMIAVGFQIKYKLSMQKIKPILVGLGLKLIILPLVSLAIYKFFNVNLLSLKVSVLQSGMPPMVTAGALAMSANLEKEISAALVGYGLLLSFITLPLLKFLISL